MKTMKTLFDTLIKFFNNVNYLRNNLTFEDWKKYLRQHDVTNKVANMLDGVPQGSKYHPEFDALKHTWLVCRAVIKLDRFDLLEAALLHDYGKGSKTTIGVDRIYSFGHAKESTKFVDEVKLYLQHYELTRRIVEKHMDLPLGHRKLKLDVDMNDFVNADKVISKSIFDKESSFFEKVGGKVKESYVFFKQRNSTKKVYILVGIPGSGKSRFLQEMRINNKYIVSPDDIRRDLTGDVSNQDFNSDVWDLTKILMKVKLIQHGKVYLDATNVNKWLRVEFMSDFNNCRKIALVFDVDSDVAINRIKKDMENKVDRANVPENYIKKSYKLFKKGEESLLHEFNEVRYV